MCEISTNLKLCTCNTQEFKNIKNHWSLHRSDGRMFFRMGEIMPPKRLADKIEKLNKETLLHLLNERNCFDFDLIPAQNDKLILNFTIESNKAKSEREEYLTYAFVFENSNWVSVKYDPFDTNSVTILEGKITSPFK